MLRNPHREPTVPEKNKQISPHTQTIILTGIAVAIILLTTHMLLTRSFIASGIPLIALLVAWMTLFR